MNAARTVTCFVYKLSNMSHYHKHINKTHSQKGNCTAPNLAKHLSPLEFVSSFSFASKDGVVPQCTCNLPTFPYLMLIISQCWQSIVLQFFHERSASSDFFFLKSRSWTDVNLTDISNLQPKIKRKTSIKKIWSLFSYTSLSSRGLPK